MANEIYNEIELLHKCLKGSNDAFGGIVAKYQSLVCAITYSATGDTATSEDMAQEVFVNAWKNLAQLKNLSKFRAWLCGIARNVVLNHLRNTKHDVAVRGVPMDSFDSISHEGSDPADRMISKEQEAVVREALGRIPEEYREPLVLFYREEQSVREVAAQLELSEEAVRTRLSRARLMLKNEVEIMIEKTIGRSKPGKAFTTAVMAGIAGIGIGASGAAAVTGIGMGIGKGTAAAGSGAVTAGIMAKILTAAAVIAVGISIVVAYKYIAKSNTLPDLSVESVIVGEQKKEQTASGNNANENSQAAILANAGTEAKPVLHIVDENSNQTFSEAVPEKEARLKAILNGYITDIETGEPVRDAEIRLNSSSYWRDKTRPDPNGFYSFRTIPTAGFYSVAIFSREYIGIGPSEGSKFAIEPNSCVKKDFKLKKACMVEMHVIDEEGKPVGNAIAEPSDSQDKPCVVADILHTDSNGYTMLGGFKPSATPYQITVTCYSLDRNPGRGMTYGYAPGYARITLADPNIIESMEVVLKKGFSVRGYAAYGDGKPAGRVEVIPTPNWWHFYQIHQSYTTEPNGYFTLEHMTEGEYTIGVNKIKSDGGWYGTMLKEEVQFPLAGQELLILNIPQKSPSSFVSIKGQVSYKDRRTDDWVQVQARKETVVQSRCGINLNLRNTFELNDLEPGVYDLEFIGNSTRPKKVQAVEAPCEGLNVELEYVGQPVLRGTVVDSNGRKVEAFKAKKWFLSNSGRSDSSWIDFENTNGRFELGTNNGPGIYQIQVEAIDGRIGLSKEFNTDTNELVVIKLKN